MAKRISLHGPVCAQALALAFAFCSVLPASPAIAQQDAAASEPAAVHWSIGDARQLLHAIETIGSEGLNPADYRPRALSSAIAEREGPQLDSTASALFTRLATDLRDGHTPRAARLGYMMADSDAQDLPIAPLMQRALASGQIAAVLAALDPASADFAALKRALAETPASDSERRDAIRINMDRWRWLPRDPGNLYLLVNVPEFRLRLVVGGETLASHRVIVGKPGRTATPQITTLVRGVVFNPTWTPPQSIVVGEGLGAKVLANPRWAASRGYVATRRADGSLSIVQQPGPLNALGAVKLDMPNPQAVFIHDTPSKALFEREVRAFSHGCIRTEGILQLGQVLTILGHGPPLAEVDRMIDSGKLNRAPLARPIPVTIAYFTMGLNDAGELVSFPDIYHRDPAVLAVLE